MATQNLSTFLSKLEQSIHSNTFVKLTLSGYRGGESDLKQVIVHPVTIKDGDLFSIVSRYTKKDITKNFDLNGLVRAVKYLLGRDFRSAHLFTTTGDSQLEILPDGRQRLKSLPASKKEVIKTHDKQKEYIIPATAPFLYSLQITSQQGEVLSDRYAKFRQINKFIEHLSAIYQSSELKNKPELTIYDFGSGKSYLTFATYYFLTQLEHKQVRIFGIDTNAELIEHSNQVAKACGYDGLQFVCAEINKVSVEKSDIVLALHACDTATDDALVQAINSQASIVVAAPCCHKYVRHHMQLPELMEPILKHGILAQRESDIVTDGLRALTLEYFGYKTQVFEFISSEHTAKNLLLTATKKNTEKNSQVLAQIKEIKNFFHLSDFYLDRQLSI